MPKTKESKRKYSFENPHPPNVIGTLSDQEGRVAGYFVIADIPEEQRWPKQENESP